MRLVLPVSCLSVFLAACGGSQPNATAAEAAQKNKPVYEAVVEPLDRAKQAESEVFKSAERQKKQAEEL
ncbi:hypothetical protein [Methylomonas sp. DH-1]|uniref:hypothetical protein n=1 Tax=Methylomonas sp. (strain DH-1) TaxID=1727196 RepID=UPI0007C8F2DF|nr:hypothetical protein [Methylomonas sp. DH-1]ANE57251.1 hypothetical protein AYM39_20085 [Methylomonas sp. DH-1]